MPLRFERKGDDGGFSGRCPVKDEKIVVIDIHVHDPLSSVLQNMLQNQSPFPGDDDPFHVIV